MDYNPKRAVSEFLNSLGIPGLKYLDQMSRGRDPKHVVFNGDDATKTGPGKIASDFLLGFERKAIFDKHGGDPKKASKIFNDELTLGGNIPPNPEWVKAGKILERWADSPSGISYGDKRTRNYVVWDQDLLDRLKTVRKEALGGFIDKPLYDQPRMLG